jgi:hypothetical protein
VLDVVVGGQTLHPTDPQSDLFRTLLVGVLLLFEDDAHAEPDEALEEALERPSDAKIELGSIVDVRIGGSDEHLKPPHHGVLEGEAVDDRLSLGTLVSEDDDGVAVLVEPLVLGGLDDDGVLPGSGEWLHFCLAAIDFEFHVVLLVLLLLVGLTSRPRGQREGLDMGRVAGPRVELLALDEGP